MKSEKHVLNELRSCMEKKGWLVEKVWGNITNAGWPDLYCYHEKHGERWVETKSKRKYHKLGEKQVVRFRKWSKKGVKIWVLRGGEPEEYKLLFKDPNWKEFIPKSMEETLDQILKSN